MKRTLYCAIIAYFIGLWSLYGQVISHEYNLRLNPDQDAHYVLSGTDRGYRSAFKFNISRIPQGAIVKTVQLNVHVLYSEVNWDGDVNFYNLNHQGWLETYEADTLEASFKSDSTHQDSLFGMFQLGWHKSIDLTQIFMRDYLQKNEFCTIFMTDPDDQNLQFNPGMPLFDHDTLVCGEEAKSSKCVFWSSESQDTSLKPFLGILYCFHTDTQLVLDICDSITLNGQTFYTTGMYQQVIPTWLGCDSTIHIDLKVRKSTSDTLTLSSCDSLDVNGQRYYRSGLYQQTLINAVGCDSLLILNLTIHKSSETEIKLSDCDTVYYNGIAYTATGIYFQKLTDVHGCDSILKLNVSILPTTFGNIVRNACDSLLLHGQTYYNSGVYTILLTNANGCDSILILNLTMRYSTTAILDLVACDSARVNGVSYYNSGTYKQVLRNAHGCDSVIFVNLNLFRSYRDTLSYVTCNGIVINGKKYDSTGVYVQTFQSVNSCDSIIVLNITIHHATYGTVSYTACDSIKVNGENFDSSGVYTQLLTNSNGCDSILILQLTVNYTSFGNVEIIACDSAIVNGVNYDSSGIYYQKLTNSVNCDSLLTIEITIPEIDTAIIVNGNTLTSIDTNSHYQWVDCDKQFEPLPGDTNRVFTASKSGNYALVFLKQGCSDTSSCYPVTVVGTQDGITFKDIYISPNPSLGPLSIHSTRSFDAKDCLWILDLNGREWVKLNLQGLSRADWDLSELPPGIYLIELRRGGERKIFKWYKTAF